MPPRRILRIHAGLLCALFVVSAIGTASAAGQMGGQMRGATVGFTSPTAAPAGSITVTGMVLNATSGLPVARALIQLNDRAVLTDHEGKFEFDQFASAGNATLQVTKPGFYGGLDGETATNTMLRADQMAAPIVVRLYPEAVLTGTLTAADGTPLPQVLVTAQRSVYGEAGHQWSPAGNNITNSRGEFRLAVPPGDYRLETAFSPRLRGTSKAILPLVVPTISSSATSESVHLSSGAEERFDLHPIVGPAYTVTVQMEPSPDRGFPMISARSGDGTVISVSVARNGPDGDMRIELPSGTFTLMANLNMGEVWEYGETTVTVADRPVSGAVLRLATVPPIPVEMIQDTNSTSDNKTPPTIQQLGLMIEPTQDVTSRRGSFSAGPTTSRDRGSYFHGPPGTYHFMARNPGQWFVKSATYGTTDLLQQDLAIAPGSGSSPIVVTVSNQTGSLHGTATVNGNPSSAWISLIPTGPSATPVYVTRSGPDGSFSLPHLPPGSYQAIGFEGKHSANYRDPRALAAYSTYVHTVTVSAGDKATLDVNAVPSAELVP